MRRSALYGLAALALAAALPAAAQQPTPSSAPPDALAAADLPPEVVARITAFFNDPETLHFTGRTRIPPDAVIRGDVAVLGGPLVVAGRIEGTVVVINGGVELLPGGAVAGGLTVVGGQVTGLERARVGGEVIAYSGRLRYERRDDRIVALGADSTAADLWPVREDEEGGWAIGASEGEGRQDFVVATGQSYNRVEGLPITFGPVVETGGRNPTRLRASAIYRTEEGFALGPGRWGYDVRLEQFVGGHGSLRVGAAVRSVVDPIEAWHLSKLENGLSTFFLHRDYRDHYERKGWSAYTTLAPPELPVSLTAEFRSEDHHSLPSGSPWTLFDNDEPWRPQPLVAEGRLKSLALRSVFDTRSEPEDPASGWYVVAGVERSLDSELVRPAAVTAAGLVGELVPAERFGDFATGTLDIRRYNRISPNSRLNLRVMAAGSLDGSRLPPQRQHALGGEGSLPGYGLFSLDCQARGERVFRAGDVEEDRAPDDQPSAYVAGYGCDRVALFQAEYRGSLRFRFRWNDLEGDEPLDGASALEAGVPGRMWNADFAWVAFVDAGGGWAVGREAEERTVVDVGFGLLFGTVGVYGAIPLEGGNGVNLFVRLAPRF